MGLGWDADSRTIVVELLAVSEEEVDESVVLDDGEEGPDALRVFLSPVQAQGVRRARREGRLGRPPAVPAVRRAARPGRATSASGSTATTAVPRSRSDHRSRGPARPGRPGAAAPRADRDHRQARRRLERHALRHGRARTASTCGASTSRCAASGRCGTSRTARSPGARWPAILVSEAAGWHVVPPTLLRDGPFGPGMVQVWVDTDDERELVDVLPPTEVPSGWLGVLRARDGARRAGGAGPRRRPRAAGDGGVRRGGEQRRPQGRARARGRRRPDLRRRPRAVPARRAQAAHGAVGLGRAADAPDVLEPLREAARRARRGGRSATSWASTSPAARCARCRRGWSRCSATPCFPEPAGYGPAIPWPAF